MHKTLGVLGSKGLAALGLALALILSACGGTATQATPTPSPELTLIVGGSDLAVGRNRIGLLLLDARAQPVTDATVSVELALADDPEGTVRSRADAVFTGGDTGVPQATYVARPTLDTAGTWRADVIVQQSGQRPVTLRKYLLVKQQSDTPSIGSPAPRSTNRTVNDAPLESLTSERPIGDRDFYSLSIAEAIERQKPLLVVFSTPAFCATRTCGPQLKIAQELKARYGDRMSFVHIEIFDNPDELLEGKGSPKVRGTVLEWHLQTEPWVFIVDKEGNVAAKFEGLTTAHELEEAIQEVLA